MAEIRSRVSEVTRGLTCSAGIAPNFLLAKMAADRHKPNGQVCTHTYMHACMTTARQDGR